LILLVILLVVLLVVQVLVWSSFLEAFKNIRTPISLCCMVNSLQSIVHRCNFHSVDDVSVLVNPMGTTFQVLKEQNISISTATT
jgi:hypothetical protein